jgi:hypothetical protein
MDHRVFVSLINGELVVFSRINSSKKQFIKFDYTLE